MGFLFAGLYNGIPLLAAAAAAVISLLARQRDPQRATFALIGFGVLALGFLIGLVFNLATTPLIDAGVGAFRVLSIGSGVLQTLTLVAGLGMLVLALFKTGDGSQPPAAGPGASYGHGQPAAQPHPAQQPYQPQPYQQQPYPAQQQPYPQQPFPAQQQPYQQPPGQPQPGQPQPGQPYPGQGQPPGQYPTQQAPGQQYPGY